MEKESVDKKILQSFKDLRVWKRAYELSLEIYRVTGNYPKEEMYGIVSQMRRSSVSIVSNIAEGYARRGRKEYVQFLSVAYASLSELETQILLSKDLGFLGQEGFDRLIRLKDDVGGMLYRLMEKLVPESGV